MSDASSPFQPPAFQEGAPGGDELDVDLGEDDELDEDLGGDDELDEDLGGDDELDEELEADSGAPAGNAVSGGAARAVLEHVARSIVDEPDAVAVEVAERRGRVELALHVAPGDMGRIIGKRGRVAQALRTVVRAAAASEGTDASVDIVD